MLPVLGKASTIPWFAASGSWGPARLSSRAAGLGGAASRPAPRLPPRRREPPARGPARALLSAARPAAQPLEVALDLYRVLRISHLASVHTITRCYTEAINNPPAAGYSQAALEARALILQGARDVLLDSAARREYDRRVVAGDVVETVPPEFVAGALALLQECGQAGAVAAAGERWLQASRAAEGSAQAGDAALAVALARWDLAQGELGRWGDVFEAEAHLEAGLRLLRHHSPHSALLRTLQHAQRELQPRLALALLALPAGEQQRERGMDLACAVLLRWAEGEAAGPDPAIDGGAEGCGGRSAFLAQLHGCLTAAEQVELYQRCGTACASSPPDLYTTALALIAEGSALLSVPHIRAAAALLEGAAGAAPAEADAAPGEAQRGKREELGSRCAVALSVCQLLLGDEAGAAAALGLGPAGEVVAGGPKCSRTVLQFVRANCPDRDDLLPGLCLLAERWTEEVALCSFRAAGGEPPQFSLSAWFAAPQVERALSQPQQAQQAQQAQQRHHEAGARASSLNALSLSQEPGLLGRRSATAGALAAAGAAVWRGAARGAALLPVPFVWGLAAVLASVGLLDTGVSKLSEESNTNSSSSTVGGAGAGAGTACQADATPQLAPAASSGPEAASEDRDSSAEPPAPAAAPLLPPSSSMDGGAMSEAASDSQPAAHAALHDGAGRPAANGAPPAAQLGAAGAGPVVMDAAVVHQLEDLMPELGISTGSPTPAPGGANGSNPRAGQQSDSGDALAELQRALEQDGPFGELEALLEQHGLGATLLVHGVLYPAGDGGRAAGAAAQRRRRQQQQQGGRPGPVTVVAEEAAGVQGSQARAVALKRGFGPAGQALCRRPELDALALGAAQQAALELAAAEGEAEAQQGSQQAQQAQQQVHAR